MISSREGTSVRLCIAGWLVCAVRSACGASSTAPTCIVVLLGEEECCTTLRVKLWMNATVLPLACTDLTNVC